MISAKVGLSASPFLGGKIFDKNLIIFCWYMHFSETANVSRVIANFTECSDLLE